MAVSASKRERKHAMPVLTWLVCLPLAAGCGHDPVTPSPLPSPSGQQPTYPVMCNSTVASTGPIGGCWTGTFDTSDPADCHTNTPATAAFKQDGSTITGTLNAVNACGLEGVSFEGTLEGNQLRGSLVKNSFAGTATGMLSSDSLEMVLSDLWSSGGSGQIPAGQMHLHRIGSPLPSPLAPSISAVTPATAPAGSDDITISITGSGFHEASRANAANPDWTFAVWDANGVDEGLLTRFVSDTQVTAIIPAKLLKHPGLAQLIVVNGDSMGWSDGYHGYPQSGPVSFTVVEAR